MKKRAPRILCLSAVMMLFFWISCTGQNNVDVASDVAAIKAIAFDGTTLCCKKNCKAKSEGMEIIHKFR